MEVKIIIIIAAVVITAGNFKPKEIPKIVIPIAIAIPKIVILIAIAIVIPFLFPKVIYFVMKVALAIYFIHLWLILVIKCPTILLANLK